MKVVSAPTGGLRAHAPRYCCITSSGPCIMASNRRTAVACSKLWAFGYVLSVIQCLTWLPRAAPEATAKFSLLYGGTAASWTAAEADCVSKGGHLASISNSAENLQVQALCAQNLPNAQLNSPANSGYWIGLNDQAKEATYVWTDGTPFSYTAWHTGPLLPQPDDSTQTQYVEDCVLFVVATDYLGWHDWGCVDRQPYVCKVPVASSPSPSPAVTVKPSPTVPSPSTAPAAVPSPAVDDPSTSSSSSSSSSATSSGAAATGSTIPATTTATAGTTAATTAASGSSTTASDTVSPSQFVTGTVSPVTANSANPSSTASSLTSGANTANSSNQSATASNTSSGGDNNDKWKLVVSIVVPVLTGLAALITIAYTGWKWWHKRQATLARRRGVGLVGPHGSNVKPLIAVDV